MWVRRSSPSSRNRRHPRCAASAFLHAVLLALGPASGLAGTDPAGTPAPSAPPALASFETVTERLCRCALEHEEGSADFEQCRGTHVESWHELDEEITRLALTSDQLARFLRTSALAVDCLERPASYHASATVPAPQRATRAQSAAVTAAASREGPARLGRYSYRAVAIRDLSGHLGKLVRVAVRGRNPVRDELVSVNRTELVLRHGRSRGGGAYGIALREVERVEVLDRWP